MQRPDHYATLELASTASSKEIEDAYERLARLYQPDPDRNPSDPEKLRQINEAFDTLDDPERRADYDRSRAIDASSPGGAVASTAPPSEPAQPPSRSTLFAVGLIALGAGALVAAIVLAVFAILDDGGGESGLFQTASGLRYRELAVGVGPVPEPGDTVSVHYIGRLEDGTEFDNSFERGAPIEFVLGTGAVIPGWDEGVALMNMGDRFELIIPPELAYGEAGREGIPPNSTLIFDMQLVGVDTAGSGE
ncbi:MAG: FKBP-type peptidyl-prolyl cis-trans isomerase [Chloroflexi bacterium]|nr:FKBP-type peptidyl-prolyl cis-trans isomerase [Chloroflexota bacterium]